MDLQDPVFIDFFAREQLPAEDTGAGSNEKNVPFPGPSRPVPRPTFTNPRASRLGPSTSNHPPAFPTPKLAIPKDPRKGLASFPEPERQDPMQEIHAEHAVQLDQILAHVEALGHTQKEKILVQEGQAAIFNSIRDWRSSRRKGIIKDLKEQGVKSDVLQALLRQARSQYEATTQGKNASFIKSGKLFDKICNPK